MMSLAYLLWYNNMKWTDSINSLDPKECYVSDYWKFDEESGQDNVFHQRRWVEHFIKGSSYPYKDTDGVYWKYSMPVKEL